MTAFDVLPVDDPEEESMEEALTVPRLVARRDGEDSDSLLAEAARSDSSAFGELYERYYLRVYRYVYHRVGNASDAEDLTALIFMKALEALAGFKPRHNGFAPWLFRIARNAVVDHYRRGRRHSPLEGIEQQAPEADPAGQVLHDERSAELVILMEHLSTDQRDVVLMRYVSDLSFTEIAAALGKKEPAVRMLLHRGLRKLKAVMDNG